MLRILHSERAPSIPQIAHKDWQGNQWLGRWFISFFKSWLLNRSSRNYLFNHRSAPTEYLPINRCGGGNVDALRIHSFYIYPSSSVGLGVTPTNHTIFIYIHLNLPFDLPTVRLQCQCDGVQYTIERRCFFRTRHKGVYMSVTNRIRHKSQTQPKKKNEVWIR